MCLFYTCWYFEIGKHITCWNNQLRWALQQSPLSLLHLLELLKSGVSDEWPLLLQRTTDLFRTTVSLPLCGHFPVNCCVILPDFLPTNAHPFSSPLPLTSSLRPTLFNWWRSGCIVEEKFPKESLWCMIYDRSFFYIWKNVMRKNKEKGEKSSLFITKQLFNPVAWFRVVN